MTDARHLTQRLGDELGRFNMGSTVILLFPENTIEWDSTVKPGAQARIGEAIGTVTPDQLEN